jgi:hypothetical protein
LPVIGGAFVDSGAYGLHDGVLGIGDIWSHSDEACDAVTECDGMGWRSWPVAYEDVSGEGGDLDGMPMGSDDAIAAAR